MLHMHLQELFLEVFAKDAHQNALKERKKSITYDNLCELALPSYVLLSYLFWEPFYPFIDYAAWKMVYGEIKSRSRPHNGYIWYDTN